ncbi:MAG: hypothetical protein M0P31_14650 [Solirubrobacteraceae bacterium]|nr:hypothetical protein [Solirubrobacteraceae bacterium]
MAVVSGAILALGLLSLLAPSTATYDPWAWIVWGREITEGDLSTVDGPSWKPLPVVVTTLAAPLGEDAAPYVWILVARIGALAAVALAFVLVRRIGGAAAGLVAALAIGLAPWWIFNGWLANSEGLLVAAVLGAVLMLAEGRRRWALLWTLAAGLLRPEAWPFLLALAAWMAWRGDRRDRVAVAAAIVVMPLAWLVPERWGSGDWLRAATRAQNPDPGAASLTDFPAWTVTKDFVGMLPTALWVAAAVALLAGLVARSTGRDARRRAADVTDPATGGPDRGAPAADDATPTRDADVGPGLWAAAGGWSPRTRWRTVVGTAVLGLAWLVIVVAMTEGGFSGNERYLVPPAALGVVVACAVAGDLLGRVPVGARWVGLAAMLAGVTVAAVDDVPDQRDKVVYEARMVADLPNAIDAAGGADWIRSCGPVYTHKLMVPQVAWRLGVHTTTIDYLPRGPYAVLLRTRITKDRQVHPVARDIPGIRTVARTGRWIVEAACRPRGDDAR